MYTHTPYASSKGKSTLIEDVAKRFMGDELILWKIVLCLSAFPMAEIITLLERTKENINSPMVLLQIERSLNIVKKRMGS